MPTRLVFLCAGATASSRSGGFPDRREPLDAGGVRTAAGLELGAGGWDRVVSSPSRVALETVAALGLSADLEPALADQDFGSWSGRSFASVEADAPEALMAWLAEPTRATPGGMAMADVRARVGAWMDGVAGRPFTLLAVSHATVLRAAIAQALSLPLAATLQIDIAPLATVTLSYNGRWRLQELRRPGA